MKVMNKVGLAVVLVVVVSWALIISTAPNCPDGEHAVTYWPLKSGWICEKG